ncbi:MAG: Lrp/AsnC family transcriptional regulator [Syntrophobacterales bacterium]|nr:MAG: Lrp/AsnC family transcriptional regulator [Syntrophobacterales bacterium]
MDAVDRKILNILQRDFPLDAEPFKVVGARIGVGEDDLLERVKKLKKADIIRRIGAVFDTAGLGFASTLCAAKVPVDRLERFTEVVNSYRGVTHNYLRNHEYNVWFTFIGSAAKEIKESLSDISEETGIADIISMPVKRRFKVDARFGL